ncbi:hypothetical protein niasHT_008774 [Heterodera trifolii]|uniref:G-protein coupled receptors family 1 profile domain-containing protein n=1 Tax=Heterodera trifolii TaxID=157864 RepID=A0ABD2M718_9BILA
MPSNGTETMAFNNNSDEIGFEIGQNLTQIHPFNGSSKNLSSGIGQHLLEQFGMINDCVFRPTFDNYLMIFAFCVIFCLSVVGNSIVVVVILQQRSMRSVTNLYLLNLALSDLLLSVVCMPPTLVSSLVYCWVFGDLLCKLLAYLQPVVVTASAYTLAAIALERYYAICKPLHSRVWHTRTHAMFVISLVWLVSVIANVFMLFMYEERTYNRNGLNCAPKFEPIVHFGYQIYMTFVLLVIPLVTMTVLYANVIGTLKGGIRIDVLTLEVESNTNNNSIAYENGTNSARIFDEINTPTRTTVKNCTKNKIKNWQQMFRKSFGQRRETKDLASANGWKNTSVATVGGGQSLRSTHSSRTAMAKQRLIRMLIVIVVIFFCCWTPSYIWWLLLNAQDSFGSFNIWNSELNTLITVLTYLSSCTNPITYCFLNSKFRNALVLTFGCRSSVPISRFQQHQFNSQRYNRFQQLNETLRNDNNGSDGSNEVAEYVQIYDPTEEAVNFGVEIDEPHAVITSDNFEQQTLNEAELSTVTFTRGKPNFGGDCLWLNGFVSHISQKIADDAQINNQILSLSSLLFISFHFTSHHCSATTKAVETTDAEVSATTAPQQQQQQQQQQRRMGQINVCDDVVWLDTLAWINRGDVGMKLALVNVRFNALADKHFKQRKWCFGEFHICERLTEESGAEIMTSMDGSVFSTLPLPTTPLPDSVVGFRSISIWYINEEVVNFLHTIRRLLTENIALEFSTFFTEYRSWKVMAQHIWPLLQNGISTLYLKKCDLAMLRKHVSPTVLFDCAGLHQINTQMLPECPSADGAVDEGNVVDTTCRELYTWVHSPREEGHGPVSLKLNKWKEDKWANFVNSLCKSFKTAPFPVNYMVISSLPFSYSERGQLKNRQTHERLIMSSHIFRAENGGEGFQTKVLLARFPMGSTNDQLDAWLRIAKTTDDVPGNLVHIGFNDNEIGELSSAVASELSTKSL